MTAADAEARRWLRRTARELADAADTEAAAGRPQLARAYAELALVYLDLDAHTPAGRHGIAALQAAGAARASLTEGTAASAAADIARARAHLALDRLDAALDTTR